MFLGIRECQRYAAFSGGMRSVIEKNADRKEVFDMITLESLKCAIADHDWIGFDLFDTLLFRPFFVPDDLFCQMEQELSVSNFAALRTQAENHLRRHRKQELTLLEIYQALRETLSLTEATMQAWMQLEQDMELQYCYPRNSGMALFQAAKEAGKKVAIVTDMYLPEAQIAAMLRKIGAGAYDRLFLSAKLGFSKANGGVYRRLKTECCAPNRFLQIGDNRIADVEIPRCLGFHAMHLPHAGNGFRHYGRLYPAIASESPSLAVRCGLALAANHYFDDPFQSLRSDCDWNADPYFVGLFLHGAADLPAVVQAHPQFRAGTETAVSMAHSFFGKALPVSEAAKTLLCNHVTAADRAAFAPDAAWTVGDAPCDWNALPPEPVPSRLKTRLRLWKQQLR